MTARSALVISPFATVPRDAGHRRRVFQTTRALADAGYHVTFLLAAFEDGWAWSHDTGALAEMRAQWDEVMLVYASERVGRPPANGTLHHLDEWWDGALETILANLMQRRFFDVVVVHNVWLSKAFDFVHPQSTRVLETHDLFWRRPEVFARMGMTPEFFVTDRQSELFGIARADIVVSIQEQEARALLELCDRRIVNVPFFEPELQASAVRGPRHPAKTRFGVLGSANPFNVHGLNALLAALEDEVSDSFAPVEVVVGGSVGDHVRSRLPVKRLGRIDSEAEFYASVDYAVLPVFEGTGFKIKTADALAVGVPLIVSEHAASGTRIDRTLVCRDAPAMAARMAQISLRRPPTETASALVRTAREDLRARAASGEASLVRAIEEAGSPVVVDLQDAELGRDALRLQGWLGMVRVLAAHRKLVLLLAEPVRRVVAALLPPGVTAPPLWQVEALRAGWADLLLVDATREASGPAGIAALRDGRWPDSAELGDATRLAPLPLLHPNTRWEPTALRLRKLWNAKAKPTGPVFLVFVPGARDIPVLSVKRDRPTVIVDADDWDMVQTWLMHLLSGVAAGCEIVWTGGDPRIRDAVLAVSGHLALPYFGDVDGVAAIAGAVPSSFGREVGQRVDAVAADVLPRSRQIAPHQVAPGPLVVGPIVWRETCQPT